MNDSIASYERCTEISERVTWTIDSVIGSAKFDFGRKFLPETLAQVSTVDGLTDAEKLLLNQIRGLTYAHLFAFVEEFIVQHAMSMASAYPNSRPTERRALLRLAEEEVKHQLLFERVKTALLAQLGNCGLVSGAADVAGLILKKSELCVLLLTVMLELTTQYHYTEMFRASEERESLDPTFVQIFKNHWIEESQHTKLDELEIGRAARSVFSERRETAVDEVLEIGGAFDGLLKAQVDLDVQSLERLGGRSLPDSVKSALRKAQHRAYRETFLISGLRNTRFRALVDTITIRGSQKLEAAAAALSA